MSEEKLEVNYLIDDHFQFIINQIDIFVEETITGFEDKRDIDKINELRSQFIARIEIIKNYNFQYNAKLHDQLNKNWKKLLKNKSIRHSSKLEWIKRDLIKRDCVLMMDCYSLNKLSMWILGSYSNSEKQITFLKNFDGMGNLKKGIAKLHSYIEIDSLDKEMIRIICILNMKNKNNSSIQDFTDFDLSSVKIIDFQRVSLKIGLVKCCSFTQLNESLEELSMIFETVEDFDHSTFKCLINLRKLTLKCRVKTRLIRVIFDGLVNLNELYLDGSFQISKAIIKNLTNLKKLTLKNSSLFKIDSELFDNLTLLEHLNLEENQLRKIDSGSFKNLINLIFLSLENNCLSTLNSCLFKNLTKLQYLNLKNNQLSYFPNGIFDTLTNLIFLNLEYNQFTFLDTRTFSHLINLLYLQTSFNGPMGF